MITRRVGVALLAAAVGLAALGPSGSPAVADEPDGAQPEIIGGQMAPVGSFPYVVALVDRHIADPNQGQFCGGSLISPDTVLTAAHCVRGRTATSIDVFAGQVDLSRPGQRVHVRRIRVHPANRVSRARYDVALLQLPTNLPLTPVATDGPARPAVGTPATLAGWGATSNRPTFPSVLRFGTNRIRNDGACGGAITGYYATTMLCAGGPSPTPGACYGDSGSPLVIDRGGTPVQVGIASFLLVPQCASGLPTVYARMHAFRPFTDPYLDPDSPPNRPASLALTPVPGGMRLRWSPPNFDGGTAVTSYRVTVTGDARVFDLPGSARTVTIPSLVPGRRYTFAVAAQNAIGLGGARSLAGRAG